MNGIRGNDGPENTDHDSTGPNSNGHLVYIGMEPGDRISLRIHIRGSSTARVSRDRKFFVNQQSMTIGYNNNVSRALTAVAELGWFKDIGLFTQICRAQPVPIGPGIAFDNWVSEVLATIVAHHNALWRHNDGTLV
ncbi:uncharacterized protein K460DRAFT_282973 [Cucurbitaria berberidis CBS 394.84]|uniref:Uncharacterized protein n=1 Tax=Cucurbitaria berberidis CBS 394.84 TaxID=1168544 RepID=A0A9P4GI84_9PLEO|nr:uncharacterized protein K460DRAFT_282973 [Cucurbitaria berberidis CBS 394.84]KAF1845605.1 hypothetical protein K460DRAFT_282973 [Cucurbitaria berberidis CBS 394.84]